MNDHTPEVKPQAKSPEVTGSKMSKIKLAFLYILIGGLVVSALISVVAILIGEFNEIVVKALLTTVIFVTHSLLILALVLADKHGSIGKSILSTTIFIAIFANMITATLGTWEVWKDSLSGQSLSFYAVTIGAAFIATGVLKLRNSAHKATSIATYVTIGLVVAFVIALIPWLFTTDLRTLGDLYYRIIGAISILFATAFSLAVIFNRIAASQHKVHTKKAQPATPGGLVAIYITIGIVTSFYWMIGAFALLITANTKNYSDSYYEVKSNNRYRN